MELYLGTVQFGMDYGIRNQKKPTLDESIEILEYAVRNGIDTIDTAYNYGDAEKVVGAFLKQTKVKRENLQIFSKLKPNILDDEPFVNWEALIIQNLEESLERLGTDYLDGYLLHSSRYIFDERIVEQLERLKEKKLVHKIGVSIYEPEEAKKAAELPMIDAIQIPFSIFDQRLLKENFFKRKEVSEKEIFSRSAFLQGLILMDEEEVPEHLSKAKPIIQKIKEICCKENINRVELAIQFVKQQTQIDYLVFGVDNLDQLKQNICFFNRDTIDQSLLSEIAKDFDALDADLVMPSLWAK